MEFELLIQLLGSLLFFIGFTGSGSGTSGDPYIITTYSELTEIEDEKTAFYELGNDIDASGQSWSALTDGGFTLDGAGFTISNLTIDSNASSGALGFIRILSSGTSGTTFNDIKFDSPTLTGGANYRIGLLVGNKNDALEINRLEVTNANINADGSGISTTYMGMIYGLNSGGDITINDCKLEGTLEANSSSQDFAAGGAFGRATADVDIVHMFVVPTMVNNTTGTFTEGGVFAEEAIVAGASFDGCFWDSDVGPSTDAANADGRNVEPKTTAELQDVATFTDTAETGLTTAYDFVGNPNDDAANNDYWDIDTGYPFLAQFADTGVTLTADQGSYTLTGQTANLLRSLLIDAQQGSFTLTGQQSNLLRDLLITADQGTYVLTGQQASLLRDLFITANQGSYTLTGQTADLFKTFVLTAESGTYNTSGSTATFLEDEVLQAAQGSYTFTGNDAILTKGLILTADQGTYTVSGQNATLLFNRVLAAQQGNYTLTGQDADLLLSIIMAGGQGTYTLAGQDATLTESTTGNATSVTLTVEELNNIALEAKNLYNIIITAEEKID